MAMSALETYWRKKHGETDGEAPAAVAPATPAPAAAESAPSMSSMERYWRQKHGETVPDVPGSTEREQQAARDRAAGKNLGQVNVSYTGEFRKPLGAGNLSPAQQYQHLISLGASPNEAHLLTSAAASESSLNPFARHDNDTGYGLYGHRLERLDEMRKFAGAEWPTWQQQNAFALKELRNRPEWTRVNNAQNARDLAIAQMYYERPAGFTTENPTAGHNFAGRLETLNKFAGMRGENKIALGELTPEWGAGHSIATGLTVGAAPAIQAGYEAGYVPLPFGMGFPASRKQAYQQHVTELEQQRQLYNKENPLTGYGLEGLGTVASTAFPVARAGQVLGRVAETAAPMLPAVEPYVAPAMRFLSGEAGQAIPQVAPRMPGVAGAATRVASSGAQGAIQGAGQTALEAGVRGMGGSLGESETPLTQQFGTSLLAGGALGPVFSKLVSPRAGGALAPQWAERVREVGQTAAEQFNIPVHPGQFAQGEAREFFNATAPQSLIDAQNKRFTEEAAKFIGEKELTPEAIKNAKTEFGTAMDATVASIPNLRLTPTGASELTRLYNEADRTLRSKPARKAVQGLLMDIAKDFASGTFNGKLYRSYTQAEGGEISRLLSETSNEIRQHYGTQLNKIMEDILRANDPVAYAQVKKLQSWYRDIKTLEPHATTSGIADPKAIANAVASEGSRTDLAKLAPIGEYLQKTQPTGEAAKLRQTKATSFPQKAMEFAQEHWRPLSAGGYAAFSGHIPLIGEMLAAGGPMFQYGVPAAILASGAPGSAAKTALKSPQVRKRVFRETLGQEARRTATHPLRGAVSFANPLFNQE